MAGTLSAGVNSLILKLDTPYDTIRTSDIRDDLIKVKVWCSTTVGFTPSDTNKVFDGLSLSIIIPNLTAGTTYYVKYAFISEIDEAQVTYSSELSAVPIVASAQTVDISGYSAFVKNSAGTTFTPPTASLTAVLNGITSPGYTWTIIGGTLSSINTASTTVTPAANATSVSVTLSVTGTGITTAITKTIVMAVVTDGTQGFTPPTFYISNYGSVFRRDIDNTIYPNSITIETGYSNFKSSPAPTFQWKKNGTNIVGATNFSYSVPSTDYATVVTNTYSCVVTGKDLGGNDSVITSSTTIPLVADGTRGPRTATGYLYYQTPVAINPGQPTVGTYNFSTGQFSTLTDGWGYLPISPSTTDTTLKGWSCRYSVTEPNYGSATNSTVVGTTAASITFDGIVTFTNYANGTTPLATAASVAGKLDTSTANSSTFANSLVANTTVIDGGKITTGIISANRLDLSGVLTVASVGTGGTTQIDGARITTGTINAARLNLSGYLQVGTAASDINSNSTDINGVRISTGINGGNITTGAINANRLTIGQTTGVDRIRLYDNKIEIWANNGSGTSVRRVVLGDLS